MADINESGAEGPKTSLYQDGQVSLCYSWVTPEKVTQGRWHRQDDLDGAAGGNRATKTLRLAFFCFLLGSRPARWGKDLA